MVVDGVSRLIDLKLARRRVWWIDESEKEGFGRAGKFSPLESATPGHIRVTSKYTTTGSLRKQKYTVVYYSIQTYAAIYNESMLVHKEEEQYTTVESRLMDTPQQQTPTI